MEDTDERPRRDYRREREEKKKKRPQMKGRCQLRHILTISREKAEERELRDLREFREADAENQPTKKRK